MNNIKKLILEVEQFVNNPKNGLPDDVFYFVGRMTPFINVDLLIKSPDIGTILTWREDIYSGKGWHLPGGIIRFREKISKRIQQVATKELGIKIKDFRGPIAVNQILTQQKERSHFISLLYECSLNKIEKKKIVDISKKNKNIKFFKSKPKKLLKWHKIYSSYI